MSFDLSPKTGNNSSGGFRLTAKKHNEQQKDIQQPLLEDSAYRQAAQDTRMKIQELGTKIMDLNGSIVSYRVSLQSSSFNKEKDEKTRQQIQDNIMLINNTLRQARDCLSTLKDLYVPAEEQQSKKVEYDKLNQKLGQHTTQLLKLVESYSTMEKESIQNYQKMQQANEMGMSSLTEGRKKYQNQVMINDEENQRQQLQEMTYSNNQGLSQKQISQKKRNMQQQAEAESMAFLIDQRQTQLSQATNLMQELNLTAQTIAIETQKQGNNIVEVDKKLGDATDNMEQANDQLEQVDQGATNSCLKCLLVLVFIILVALICYMFSDDSETVYVTVDDDTTN